MIRLGLRLTLNGGRGALVRLLVTAVAVALGVAMLLVTLAAHNALNAENARAAWLNTSASNIRPSVSEATSDPLWWALRTDQFGSLAIERIDVAATGPRSPVPPGIPRLPGPGQFYVSPALARLLRSTPAGQLGDRFPGQEVGTIGPSALPVPGALIAVVGEKAGQLSKVSGAQEVRSIETAAAGNGVSGGPGNFSSTQLEIILAVGALALLFPVLVFIGTATRLSAASREQRFAAMRLAGATPRQVSVISAVEACAAALAGVAAGFGLFFLLRPALQQVPFTGEPFTPGDLSLNVPDVLGVALGVPAAAVFAARIALRRVQFSPLGVSRRVTPRAPAARRVLPLLAGLAWLALLAVTGHPKSASSQIQTYFLAFLMVMAGLVIAGPWLTMAGARYLAERASRPYVLIAGRRLSDNPGGAFRAVSGLIVALFITSAAVGVSATIIAVGGSGRPVATNDTLALSFAPDAAIPQDLLDHLVSVQGTEAVAVIRSDPLAAANGNLNQVPGLISCAELARTPALGSCAPGVQVATIRPDLGRQVTGRYAPVTGVWPAASISAGRLQALPAEALVVRTDGSGGAIARVQTTLETTFPYQGPPSIIGGITPDTARSLTELKNATDVVIVASLLIAGCSLAVSVAAGISDRKRPFSLLRLTGVPVQLLHRVVALEAAGPLIVISVLSAGTGLVAAGLFLHSELGVTLQVPGAGYYAIVLAGLAASLAVIAATLPIIERVTGPEVARNE